MVATTWSLFPKYLPHENILRDWYIICGAWKWLGKKKVHTCSISAADALRYSMSGARPPDYEAVAALHAAVQEADFIVGHNGDAFDLKKLNARVIFHGLPALPPIRTVDTLKEARKIAKFSSNRLDYLAGHLVDGGKMSTSYSLWLKIMHGDEKALRYMLKYNKKDVVELEAVYNRLLPYMKSHPNVNLGPARDVEGLILECPKCGSTHVQRRGTAKTQTRSYARYQCQGCGSWSKSSSINGGPLT